MTGDELSSHVRRHVPDSPSRRANLTPDFDKWQVQAYYDPVPIFQFSKYRCFRDIQGRPARSHAALERHDHGQNPRAVRTLAGLLAKSDWGGMGSVPGPRAGIRRDEGNGRPAPGVGKPASLHVIGALWEARFGSRRRPSSCRGHSNDEQGVVTREQRA
jgi:hypothetical protein